MGLNYHIPAVHEGKKKEEFKCLICDKGYSCKSLYTKHMKNIHETKNEYKCQHCEASFSSKGQLTRHTETVHEKNNEKYKCLHCSEIFPNRYNLTNHTKEVHDWVKPVKCPKPKCIASFLTIEDMEKHVEVRDRYFSL